MSTIDTLDDLAALIGAARNASDDARVVYAARARVALTSIEARVQAARVSVEAIEREIARRGVTWQEMGKGKVG